MDDRPPTRDANVDVLNDQADAQDQRPPLADAIDDLDDHAVINASDDPPFVDVDPGLTDPVRDVIDDYGFAVDGKALRGDPSNHYQRVFLRDVGGDADD